MKKTLLLFLLVISSTLTFAQDKIYKNSGDVIDCEIVNVEGDFIRYYYSTKPTIIFNIEKNTLTKVVFKTGEVVDYTTNNQNIISDKKFNYSNTKTNAVKINFISPLYGSTEITYEKNIRPGKSWETALGIIGLGNDPGDTSPLGVYVKVAHKFITSPDFYANRHSYAHIMKGAYVAPEVGVRYVQYNKTTYVYNNIGSNEIVKKEEVFSVALMLKLGKQWVIDNSLLIDLYGGLGYGNASDKHQDFVPYGFVVAPREFPIAFTWGVRVGYVF
ncbi:MAG: hypothetical protein KAG96_06275 [Ichthyobacteriaceae bacterium]|nr:hypothetical protein [Ichthyobacteriaceae bacterium]